MDDNSTLRPATPSLKAAVRRARIEDAERSEVRAELRGAEIARLEMLESAIAPVFQQVPEEADMFDVGLSRGDHPRLFVDMIAFVEMGRDKRIYRFIQNMRHGPIVVAETESLDRMTEAVADYVARRLIEREKALASDVHYENRGRIDTVARAEPEHEPASRPSRWRNALLTVVDVVESIILFLIVAAVVWFLWRLGVAWRAGAF